MKTKGIPFWEQHLEHFVLGAAVLVFLAFTALQFLGNPNAVQVGTATYTPQDVDERLRVKADEIDSKLSTPGATAATIPDPVQLMPVFENQLMASIVPGPTLPALAANITPSQGLEKITTGVPFMVAQVAAPFEARTQQFMDTLLPETIEQFPELKETTPEAPYDITWVTPSAKFNIGAVRKQFMEKGPQGESPLPTAWHNNRADILDVKVYREELTDGTWTERTLIKHIPGQFSVRDRLASSVDRTIAIELLTQVADPATRQDVIQPEFYIGKVPAWVAPTKAQLELLAADAGKAPPAGEDDNPLPGLQRRLAALKANVDRVKKKMQEISCSEKPDEPGDSGRGGATGGGRGGDAGGGSSGGGGPGLGTGGGGGLRTPSGGPKNNIECDKLRKQLNRFNENVARLEADIAKLQPEVPVTPEPVEVVEESIEELPDEILIWAHDINVTPARTYRYQFVVELYNPLFGHKADLIAEQHALADQFTMVSQVSEWTDPVTVNSPLQVFITAARLPQEGNPLAGGSTAAAEVYRFRDGKTWMERFTLQLGDRVGGETEAKAGAATAMNFSTDWFLLDVTPNVLANKDDVRDGYGALALLQNLTSGELMQVRNPRVDLSSPERIRLKDEVDLAKVTAEVAVAQ